MAFSVLQVNNRRSARTRPPPVGVRRSVMMTAGRAYTRRNTSRPSTRTVVTTAVVVVADGGKSLPPYYAEEGSERRDRPQLRRKTHRRRTVQKVQIHSQLWAIQQDNVKTAAVRAEELWAHRQSKRFMFECFVHRRETSLGGPHYVYNCYSLQRHGNTQIKIIKPFVYSTKPVNEKIPRKQKQCTTL